MVLRINNQLPNNLPQLQNCIKRDPDSYKEEFIQQLNHYNALLQVFQIDPSANNKNFNDLVMFLAQVSHCYKNELKEYPNDLMNILKQYSTVLNPDVRMIICKALALLRNKFLISINDILPVFLYLLKNQNKNLRNFIKKFIINDIKNMNMKHCDAKVNSVLQNYIFSAIKDSNMIVAKTSLDLLCELYNKNIWKCAKTVNVIANCCTSKHAKILVASHRFFLGSLKLGNDSEDSEESNSDSDSNEINYKVIKEITHANHVNKNSRKRKKLLEKAKKVVKKSKKNEKAISYNFSAIHLIYDPQGMADKLLQMLEKINHRFEIKLMTMDLVSRLIGIHQLFVFNFYPFLQRYLHPHQREITKILLYSAQSAHELIPPEVIEPIIKTIANNFITERNSNECITIGLNSVREICARCPLAMSEDLLQDLVQYDSFKDKNVSSAARSLIKLYRMLNPQLLKKKDRGKPTQAFAEYKPKEYGEFDAKEFIPGAEVLKLDLMEEEDVKDDESEDDSDDNNSECWISDIDEEKEEEKEFEVDEDKKLENEILPNKDLLFESKKLKLEEKAALVSCSRILSQEEFKKLKIVQLAKQLQAQKPKRLIKEDKIELGELDQELSKAKELVSLKDIEKLYKKPKRDKESRLSSIMEGREGREQFSKRKPRMNPFASKPEKEKRKCKAFTMIKHKVKGKQRKSFHEKAVSLKQSLIKKLKNMK